MRALVLCFLATSALAQPVLKNAGVRLGPITTIDCSADAGITCTRTGSTGTGNVACSSASATELGCVSTGTQNFAGAKTFTGNVRASSYGGADGGVYAKLSDGSSLVGTGAWSFFQPYATFNESSPLAATLGAMGNLSGTGSSSGIPSKINITGLYGSAFTDGLNIDGGTVSNDGGLKGYWISLVATDDAGTRVICKSFQICESGVGPLHPRSDTSCGADGGGAINKNGYLLVIAGAYTFAGAAMLPECRTPAVNYTVNFTGNP